MDVPRSPARRPRRLLIAAAALLALGGAAAAVAGAPADAARPDGPAADTSAAAAARAERRERAVLDTVRLARAYARAAELPRLRSLLVQWRGELVGERYYRGAARTTPANIKSASKSVVSALVGIALHEGRLRGLQQPLVELLPGEAGALDSAKRAI